MASNAAGAAVRVIKAVVRGDGVEVSPEREAARLAVCSQCEFALRHTAKPKFLRCTQCGCWLNAATKWLAKARLATEDCPKGKWKEAGC